MNKEPKIDYAAEFEELAEQLLQKEPKLATAFQNIRDYMASMQGIAIADATEKQQLWFNAVIHAVTFPDVTPDSVKTIEAIGADAARLTLLMPDIKREVSQYKFTHGIKDMTFNDFARLSDPATGEPKESLFNIFVQKAEEKATRSNIMTVANKKPKHMLFPLDKINRKLWTISHEGNFKIEPVTAHAEDTEGNKVDLRALCAFDFTEFMKYTTLTADMTASDWLNLYVTAALYERNVDPVTGRAILSAQEIYEAKKGPGSKINAEDRKELLDFFVKMRKGDIFIDNTEEAKQSNYAPFKYSGSIIANDFCPDTKVIMYGKVVDNPIRILAEPALITWANLRNQGQRIPLAALQFPFNHTPFNDAFGLYITGRALRAKAGNESNVIVFTTLFETLGIYEKGNIELNNQYKSQRSRLVTGRGKTKSQLEKMLDHMKSDNVAIISDYKIFEDRAELIFNKEISAGKEK